MRFLSRFLSLTLFLSALLCSLEVAWAQETDEFLLQASKLVERQQLLEAVELLQKGLELYPNDPELLFQAGGLLIHLGRISDGEPLLERALALDPNNPRILNSQAEAKLRQGKLREAVERFRRALWHHSRDAQSHYRLAFTLFLQGDEKEARQHARQAVEINPLHSQYRRFHSLLLNVTGEAEESFEELRRAWRLDPENPEILYQLSSRSKAQGQLGQALEYGEMAWEIDSQNPLYAHHLAGLYHQIGESREADWFEARALALDEAFARYSEALRAQREGRLERAVELLEKSLLEYPDFEIALFHLAQLYSALGEKESALRSYEKLLAINPQHQEAREEEAWLHVTQGSLEKALIVLGGSTRSSTNQQLLSGYQALRAEDWETAVTILGKVVADNPLTPGLLELLAFALREMGQPEQAIAYLTKAGNLTNASTVRADIAQVHFSEAQELQKAERWKEAISVYSKLLEDDSKNATYLSNRAYCQQQAGLLTEAVRDYRAALKQKSQQWAELNLASCLYRLQRYPEAVTAWEKVVSSAPTADTYYRLGLSYSHVDRHAEAEAAFSKARRMGMETPALLYNLGLARLKTFRVEEGWKLVREAARKGYGPAAQLVARLPRR